MKRILLAGLILWSSLASAALPLKTRGQNDASTTGLDTLRLEAPNSQITAIGDQKVLVETGNGNLLINPNFEHSTTLTGWTLPNGGSGWYSDETTALREGKKSVDYYHGTSGTGGNIYQQVNPPASMRNQPFEYSIDVQGNTGAATNLKVCVLDGASQTETVCQTVTRDNTYKTYRWILQPPASGLTGIGIVADAANSFKFDKAYVGPARNIGVGVPNNVFSAKASSTGVVSDENEDFINGNCTFSSPKWTCNFVSGKFSLTPTCTIQQNAISTSGGSGIDAANTSTSAITFVTWNSGAGSQQPFTITCTRASTDFIQPAITPNQWNYGPTAYTPTLGAGFGTPTNVSFFHWRTGKYLNVSGTFTAGTTTTSAGSISLPSGLSLDLSYISINNTTSNPGSKWGDWAAGAASTYYFGNIVSAPSTSTNLIYVTPSIGNANALTPSSSVSSNVVSAGSIVAINFRVPISGWTENQNAPQLLGSVTTGNGAAAYRHEFAAVHGSTWNSSCTTTPCTITDYSDGISQVARTATGKYRIDFTTPNPTGNWTCTTSTIDGPTWGVQCAADINNAPTSSSFYIQCGSGSSNTDSRFTVTCDAKR